MRGKRVGVGEGPAAAGRQAAALFALAGVLALAGLPAPHSRADQLLIIAAADLMVALLALLTPWARLGRYSTVLLAVAGLAILAFSTVAVGGFAAGTGPFFVLLYAWLGLHHPPWIPVALAPLTTAAYLIPLITTHQPPEVISSAIVFVPVTTVVGVVIAKRVARLQQARAEVEASERWRAALLATVAHDVRSPLTSVQGALSMLADEPELGDRDRSDFLAMALRQTERMSRLVGGLLDIERVQHGLLRLDARDVDVRQAIGEAARYLPAHRVVIEVPDDLLIRADPERLEQMLVNLIANAGRHGVPPILIGATTIGERVELTVRDHGAGVPGEQLPRLFTQFGTGQSDPGSMGLGLWIVRQLALAHGGDVRYEPANPGACFVLTLPAAPRPAPAGRPTAGAGAA